jgi:peptide/nickel transport system substrate-binding protein
MNTGPARDSIDNLADDFLSRRIDRRTFFQRAAALGLTAGGAAALLAACGGEEAAAPTGATTDAATTAPDETAAAPTGGTLTIRLLNDIVNLDPAFWPSAADDQVFVNMTEGLISYKPGTVEVVNVLAEEFESSPDGLRHRFKLKEGIPFHGGFGEVTAEDVKYSYERIAGLNKPKLDSPYAGDWAALQEVRIGGTYDGEIILKEPFSPLLTTTLPVGSGLVLSKKAIEERGKKYGTNPIGSGPYEFVSWEPKRQVVLKKFADYGGAGSDAGPPPEWDELHFIPVEEDSAAEIAVETGEFDFSEVSPKGSERFEGNDEFDTVVVPTLDYGWIGMNVKDPQLEDINVRRAIRQAIDVPSLIEVGFDGKWERARAIIAPGSPIGYWEDAPAYERDVEQAKSFLDQAGVSDLELTYTYSTGEKGGKEIAEVVQANLAEIGVKVEIKPTDSAVLNELGEVILGLQLFHVSFSNNPDPSWATVWFICDQIGQWNWMSWCNEEYDRLHFAALKEQDQQKRHEMYVQMQKLWDEAAHTQWIAYRTKFFAYRAGLQPAIAPYGRFVAWAFSSA